MNWKAVFDGISGLFKAAGDAEEDGVWTRQEKLYCAALVVSIVSMVFGIMIDVPVVSLSAGAAALTTVAA